MRYSYTFPVSVPRFIHIGAPAPKAACVSGGLSQLPYLSIHEPSHRKHHYAHARLRQVAVHDI